MDFPWNGTRRVGGATEQEYQTSAAVRLLNAPATMAAVCQHVSSEQEWCDRCGDLLSLRQPPHTLLDCIMATMKRSVDR